MIEKLDAHFSDWRSSGTYRPT